MDSKHKEIQFIKSWNSQEVKEGDGALVRRVIGIKESEDVNPFIMFDRSYVRLPGGFPDHPHRGFETVTYMLEGSFLHEDSKGHKGTISEGDVQWMTAGKGIVHSELPASTTEYSIGYQLWINLNKENKMVDPKYQDYKSSEIKKVVDNDNTIKIVSGEYNNNEGPVKSVTKVQYFVVDSNSEKSSVSLKIEKGERNIFIYVNKGSIEIGKNTVLETQGAKCYQVKESIDNKEKNELVITLLSKASVLVTSGEPIYEPFFQKGPFVMNTEEEAIQAMEDFKEGKNGFEGANTWKSENSKLRKK